MSDDLRARMFNAVSPALGGFFVPLSRRKAVADALLAVARAELGPASIRPDGSHHYVSTYCLHGNHGACRLTCKSCPAECACDCGHPTSETGDDSALTRGELQDLVDSMGIDLYQASDKLDFIREMCDLNDAGGTPITTADVRNWLGYTGCGGVLVLPDEVVARLAAMSGTTPDKAATSGDAADIAGEQP